MPITKWKLAAYSCQIRREKKGKESKKKKAREHECSFSVDRLFFAGVLEGKGLRFWFVRSGSKPIVSKSLKRSSRLARGMRQFPKVVEDEAVPFTLVSGLTWLPTEVLRFVSTVQSLLSSWSIRVFMSVRSSLSLLMTRSFASSRSISFAIFSKRRSFFLETIEGKIRV